MIWIFLSEFSGIIIYKNGIIIHNYYYSKAFRIVHRNIEAIVFFIVIGSGGLKLMFAARKIFRTIYSQLKMDVKAEKEVKYRLFIPS